MDKFRDKYRTDSKRLQNWCYGWNAAYFIIICTDNKEHFFGDISNKMMHLSETGKLAQRYWNEIPKQFPFVELDASVIMPNHIHGILIIDKTNNYTDTTDHSIIDAGGITGNKNPMLHNNVSRVIRWYKGRTTFESRKLEPMFAWQSRFYDHIIRNDRSYQRIAEYIKNNPAKWQDDTFFG